MKYEVKTVEKVWGFEHWMINCDEYCGKYLIIKPGARCSYHMHPKKKETFHVFMGEIELCIDGVTSSLRMLDCESVTILPGQYHSFYSKNGAGMLEISTHHEDIDCVRLTESRDK